MEFWQKDLRAAYEWGVSIAGGENVDEVNGDSKRNKFKIKQQACKIPVVYIGGTLNGVRTKTKGMLQINSREMVFRIDSGSFVWDISEISAIKIGGRVSFKRAEVGLVAALA